MKPTHRINARIDQQTAKRVAYLAKETSQTTSEVVKQALNMYYGQIRAERSRAPDILDDSGFIACAEGPASLSSTYKISLTETWQKKHGHR